MSCERPEFFCAHRLSCTWRRIRPANAATATSFAWVCLVIMLAVGVVQLVVSLIRAVRDVNAHGAPPDTTEWETVREK